MRGGCRGALSCRGLRNSSRSFDPEAIDEEFLPADRVHAMTLVNLHGEFAEIVTAEDVISNLFESLRANAQPDSYAHSFEDASPTV